MQKLTRKDIVGDLHMAENSGSPKELSLIKKAHNYHASKPRTEK